MSSELGSFSRLALFAALVACLLSVVAEASPRAKRQISPAQQLQQLLDLYDYQPGVKRSADHKRHLAPSSEIFNEVPHNLRELAAVGKRSAIAPADQFQEMGSVYSRLFDAGRKRGSISPAADLEHQIEMQNFFDMAGRR